MKSKFTDLFSKKHKVTLEYNSDYGGSPQIWTAKGWGRWKHPTTLTKEQAHTVESYLKLANIDYHMWHFEYQGTMIWFTEIPPNEQKEHIESIKILLNED